MNIFQKGFNYVKNLLSFENDDDEKTPQYSTPSIIIKKESPVFRATIGEGMTQAQTKKAEEIVTKKPSTKSLFTPPTFKAEVGAGLTQSQANKAKTIINAQTESQKKKKKNLTLRI